jgi:hypothetical protein
MRSHLAVQLCAHVPQKRSDAAAQGKGTHQPEAAKLMHQKFNEKSK